MDEAIESMSAVEAERERARMYDPICGTCGGRRPRMCSCADERAELTEMRVGFMGAPAARRGGGHA